MGTVQPHSHAALMRHAPPKLAAAALSFEKALETSPAFCDALQAGESPAGLGDLISSSAGARGFFVHYLTNDDYDCADREEPPPVLVQSLEQSAGAETIEIMLMNVVMSAGTAVMHDRAGNTEQATSSRRTSARARILVNACFQRLPPLQPALAALNGAVASELGQEVLFLAEGTSAVADETRLTLPASAEEGVDSWLAFLERWKYDKEQLAAIAEALALCGD